MKKFTIGLSLAALAAAGTAAYADGRGAMKHDSNGDGAVSRAELISHSAQMFAKMDANNDGKLDETDQKARHAARRTRRFDKLDANSNGQIDRAEFMSFERDGKRDGKHHRMGGRSGHGGKKLMEQADTNKDGSISKAEFTAGAVSRFDKMDADKDGSISKEERQAARSDRHDKWRERAQEHVAN